MANLHEIIQWCDQTLKAAEFKDYAPNGLQIEGSTEVKHIFVPLLLPQMLLMQQLLKTQTYYSCTTVIFGKANRTQLQECAATASKTHSK